MRDLNSKMLLEREKAKNKPAEAHSAENLRQGNISVQKIRGLRASMKFLILLAAIYSLAPSKKAEALSQSELESQLSAPFELPNLAGHNIEAVTVQDGKIVIFSTAEDPADNNEPKLHYTVSETINGFSTASPTRLNFGAYDDLLVYSASADNGYLFVSFSSGVTGGNPANVRYYSFTINSSNEVTLGSENTQPLSTTSVSVFGDFEYLAASASNPTSMTVANVSTGYSTPVFDSVGLDPWNIVNHGKFGLTYNTDTPDPNDTYKLIGSQYDGMVGFAGGTFGSDFAHPNGINLDPDVSTTAGGQNGFMRNIMPVEGALATQKGIIYQDPVTGIVLASVVEAPATCGNNTTEAGEDCDSGAVDTLSCDEDCTSVVCGDGHLNAVAEECDDGNLDNNDGCNSNCEVETPAICGDFEVNLIGETCDEGGVDTASCDYDCTEVNCGDNHVNFEAGEECDDGNMENGDGCDFNCQEEPMTTCGDNVCESGETASSCPSDCSGGDIIEDTSDADMMDASDMDTISDMDMTELQEIIDNLPAGVEVTEQCYHLFKALEDGGRVQIIEGSLEQSLRFSDCEPEAPGALMFRVEGNGHYYLKLHSDSMPSEMIPDELSSMEAFYSPDENYEPAILGITGTVRTINVPKTEDSLGSHINENENGDTTPYLKHYYDEETRNIPVLITGVVGTDESCYVEPTAEVRYEESPLGQRVKVTTYTFELREGTAYTIVEGEYRYFAFDQDQAVDGVYRESFEVRKIVENTVTEPDSDADAGDAFSGDASPSDINSRGDNPDDCACKVRVKDSRGNPIELPLTIALGLGYAAYRRRRKQD